MGRTTVSLELNAGAGVALNSGWIDAFPVSPSVASWLTVSANSNGAETFTVEYSNDNDATSPETMVSDTIVLAGSGTSEQTYLLTCKYFRISSVGTTTIRRVRFSVA